MLLCIMLYNIALQYSTVQYSTLGDITLQPPVCTLCAILTKRGHLGTITSKFVQSMILLAPMQRTRPGYGAFYVI